MLQYALFTLFLASGAMAGNIDFTDCGTGKTTISSVYFDGCNAAPCHVNRGDTVSGGSIFTANAATNTLSCEIFGIIFGEEVPFPGGCPSLDGCADIIDGNCPIDVGEDIEYQVSMEILASYPAVPVTGKWTLKDDNGDVFLCFLIDIVIDP